MPKNANTGGKRKITTIEKHRIHRDEITINRQKEGKINSNPPKTYGDIKERRDQ